MREMMFLKHLLVCGAEGIQGFLEGISVMGGGAVSVGPWLGLIKVIKVTIYMHCLILSTSL